MKKCILFLSAIAISFCACNNKKTEGSILYSVNYQLPDSLREYGQYLPKQALVYFKGDSTISIQQSRDEATSVITDAKAGFMRALLKSTDKQYAVDYDKAAQAEELAGVPQYTFTKTNQHKTIAGFDAIRYKLTDKFTNDTSEAWFTRDVAIIPNSLTASMDTTLGVPLSFTTKQSGIVVKTTVKDIKFDAVPDGIFNTPKGYQFLTPQQFRDLTPAN